MDSCSNSLRPLCYMERELSLKLRAKNPATARKYGATTTVTIVPVLVDDVPLYAQADLDAAVAAERERCAVVAWTHYMDNCRRLRIPAGMANDWCAADAIRRA